MALPVKHVNQAILQFQEYALQFVRFLTVSYAKVKFIVSNAMMAMQLALLKLLVIMIVKYQTA